MSAPRRSDRRGVTLVELLVSLLILSMLVTAGNAAITMLIEYRERLETASVDAERASALRDLITSWLAAATTVNTTPTPNTGLNSSQTPTYINGQLSVNPASVSGHDLRFTTAAETPAHAPTTIMRLFVDDDDNTAETGLTLEYQVNAQSPRARVQLDPTIAELYVEFLSTNTNDWVEAPDATGVQARAVRVTLYGREDREVSGIVSLPIIAPLRTAQGAAPAGAAP